LFIYFKPYINLAAILTVSQLNKIKVKWSQGYQAILVPGHWLLNLQTSATGVLPSSKPCINNILPVSIRGLKLLGHMTGK
jgi:hypothetical protein